MKKIIFFAFALACISTVSYAQEIKEIKPFKPNAADAAKIKSLLAKMDKSSYNVEVRNTVVSYGGLKAGTVRAGAGASVGQGIGNSAWVETLLTALIKTTRGVDQQAVVELQAIAARYQQ